VVQVYGYGDALARRTLAWCALHRVPSVMISDSELFAARGRLKQALKRLIVPLVLRLPDGFLTIGDENERYFQRYGVKRSRLHRSPIPIDSPSLDDVLSGREHVREQVRESWDVSPEDLVLLAVGKSIARKRHQDLIEATGLLPLQLRRRVVVTLAGGGERTPFLQQRAEELEVRLLPLGFLPVPKLFRAYMAGDVLVHPSDADPHPLAIAEAVYCGLPVIVSDRVGSWGPTDDVQPDANGRRYPVGAVRDLSRLLHDLVEDPLERSSLARASRLIGQDRTLSYSATSYVDGVLRILGR
jgi:glycosyltransferase involved in cell wall biosynthesis